MFQTKKEKVLGVAGIDIVLDEIATLLPQEKNVVRSFLVNRAGYLIYHPKFSIIHENIWNNFSVALDWGLFEPKSEDAQLVRMRTPVYCWHSQDSFRYGRKFSDGNQEPTQRLYGIVRGIRGASLLGP